MFSFGESTTFLLCFTWLILKWANTKFVSPLKHDCRFFAAICNVFKFFLKSDHIRMVDVKGDNYQSPNHNFFVSGTPNDGFLVNTLKTLFRQLRVRLDL